MDLNIRQRSGYIESLKRFIKFITFVDLPINRKFILFSIGTIFWFLIMFIISIITNHQINSSTDRIINRVIPYERTIQKITRKLEGLTTDIQEIVNADNVQALEKQLVISGAKISDIRAFTDTLRNGGQIVDISRDTDMFIESFEVSPVERTQEEHEHINTLTASLNSLDTAFSEFAGIRENIMNGAVPDSGGLNDATDTFMRSLAESINHAKDFSSHVSTLYARNSERIHLITKINSYAMAGALIIFTLLLAGFTFSISRSLAEPVRSIINQIRALSEGRADFSRKIRVRSKDEIGVLTQDFNDFLDEIQEMTTFKKVIEEDDSLEDVYSRLGKIFSEKFGLDDFIIYEISNSQNRMKPVYPVMVNDKDIYCDMDILGNCNLCKVKKTGRVISSAEYPDICKQFRKEINKVHVCIPMVIGGNIGGVGMFLFDKKYFGLEGDDRRIFKYEQYIKESLSVIEAKRLMNTLKDSALKDALTGLYNRRFLQEYTETLVPGVLRRKKSVGLVMCDLDYFKQVNDVYGHNVGDAILKETSSVIKSCVRSSDMVIRFGGEEFLALLVDINPGEAEGLGEKIRKTIEEKKIKVPDGTLKKTISIGVSEFPGDTESFWQAIKYADVALYKAKETGRNRVVRFAKEMWTEEEF